MEKQTMEGVSLLGVWQREHTTSGADSVPESAELELLEDDWAESDGSDIAEVVGGLGWTEWGVEGEVERWKQRWKKEEKKILLME